MYNNSYEEYMRNSLGYNINPAMYTNQVNPIYEEENSFTYNQANIENMYPEIYKIIYPMVCKACMNIQENVTEDLVSRITNEIYMNVENIEITQENKKLKDDIKNSKIEKVNSSSTNNARQEDRNRNFLLRDLIRILILRELLGNPGRPPRPPFRPPFPGGFNPGPRPPFGF